MATYWTSSSSSRRRGSAKPPSTLYYRKCSTTRTAKALLVSRCWLLLFLCAATNELTARLALHRAGANGHAGVVHVLLDEGAAHVANRAGNTPLHWAVQNGQEKVVALLCERVPGLDVLAVNADGKSCISFAFERGNDKVLNILLEHPSAEKLQESKEKDGQTLLHEIAVAPGKPVLCREIGFTAPGDGEGEEDGLDNTGAALWGASLILARWVLREEEILRGRCVVELGAGCGLPGITALRYSPAEKLYITDLASKTFDNLKFNVERNLKEAQDRQQKPTTVQVLPLDWKDETTWPAAVKDGKAEVILGADLVYDPALVPPLVEVVTNLLAEGGTFMYVSALSSRAGLEDFCSRLQQAGLQLSVHAVADDMLANPMASEEKFRLHFKELSTDAFNLYKFVK